MTAVRDEAARWTDTLLIGAAAFALFALLRQEVFYHIDARLHIGFAQRGDLFRSRHLAYIPLLWALHELLAPRFEWFAIASWLSVTGMALGVALLHRATALCGLSRRDALLAAALIATDPAALFYASVAELHGPMMPAVGIAALCLVRLTRRPSAARALALGAAIALAYLMHATGLALLVMMPLLYVALAQRGQPPRQRLRALAWCGALAAAPALAIGLGVPLLLRAAGAPADAAHAAKFLLGDPATLAQRLASAPAALWREWVVACLPLSLAWLPALRLRAWRPAAAALALTIAAFVLFTAVLLPGAQSERGAYMLPLLWPAAMLAAVSTRPSALALLVLLGAWLGIRQIDAHEQPAEARAFAAAVRAASEGQPPLVLIGSSDELDHCLTHLPHARYLFVPELPRVAPEAAAATADGMVAFLRAEMREGHAVLLADGARAALRADPGGTGYGPALLQRLAQTFALHEPAAGPHRVARLQPKG